MGHHVPFGTFHLINIYDDQLISNGRFR